MGKGLTERFGALFAVLIAVGTLYAQPAINIVANAAADSVATGNVARGELISIYGTNLATSLGANFTPTSPVLSLGGASVTIGGLAAPITYASPTQLDVQVPFEITAGVPSVNRTVTVGSSTSAPYMLNVVSQDFGLAYAQVGTQITPVSQPNTAIVVASSGSQIALVAFGLGSVTPSVSSGIVVPSGTFITLATPSVTINGALVTPISSVLANGAVGVYVVTVVVPSGLSGPLTVVLGGTPAGAGATGPTGRTGATGPTGPTGPAGSNGTNGTNGANGANGPTGPIGPGGPTGPQGPQGLQGLQGIQGNTGPTGLTWQGAWSSNTSYSIGNGVSSNGSSYISTVNGNTGVPGVSANWNLLALLGSTGATGLTGTPATITVANTITGAPGTSGAVGASGTTGAVALTFTIPQGPTGPTGGTGVAATISVANTITGAPGGTAAVGASGTTGAVALTFTIPQGPTGPAATITVANTITGAPGSTASVGASGTTGAVGLTFTVPQGPIGPAATITVANTITGAPGSTASVGASGTTGAVALTFTVPQGPIGPAATITVANTITG